MAGFTPVSSMIRNELPDYIGVDQLKRKNALAEQDMDLRQENAAQFRRQNDLLEESRKFAFDENRKESYRKTGASLVEWLDRSEGTPEYAQVLQSLTQDGEAQQAGAAFGVDVSQLGDRAYRTAAKAKLQMAPPEQIAPIGVRREGGYTFLSQGDKIVPGSVRAPERAARDATGGGGQPSPKYGAARVGVNPETGKPEYFQTDQFGNVKWIGAASAAGAETLDRETAKSDAKSAADLPRIQENARQMFDVLFQLKNSPLELVFGAASVAPIIPGTAQADAVALWEQVQGKAFLQAFDSLKGGGQITEKEGEKATAAITRLSQRKMSPGAAREAIKELQAIAWRGLQRAQKAQGGGAPAGAAPAAPAGGVVKVASPQEAMALPPGTKFQTPDGRIKVRP